MPLDELVLKAMARWPNVPAVCGWLRLTRRGRWMLVDRGVAGFDEALHGAGSEITSPPIVDFIGRNYQHDAQGNWFWQNGPQRVFVDLELAPLIFRVLGDVPSQSLVTHTGYPVQHIESVHSDEAGNLWLLTEWGAGCVDDRDLGALDLYIDEARLEARLAGSLRLQGEHPVHLLPQAPGVHFGFVSRPRY